MELNNTPRNSPIRRHKPSRLSYLDSAKTIGVSHSTAASMTSFTFASSPTSPAIASTFGAKITSRTCAGPQAMERREGGGGGVRLTTFDITGGWLLGSKGIKARCFPDGYSAPGITIASGEGGGRGGGEGGQCPLYPRLAHFILFMPYSLYGTGALSRRQEFQALLNSSRA